MRIRIIFVGLFCLLFLSCNNFQSNPSDYFDDFIKVNIKSKALDISNKEDNKKKNEEKSQLLSNLDYYFRIQNNQNKDNKQEKIIAIEEKIDFGLNDKIELYKVTDRLSKSVFLQADLDLISLSLFLDSSLIKQYEKNQIMTFSDLMPRQIYTLVVTFNIDHIIHEAKFYIHLKEES